MRVICDADRSYFKTERGISLTVVALVALIAAGAWLITRHIAAQMSGLQEQLPQAVENVGSASSCASRRNSPSRHVCAFTLISSLLFLASAILQRLQIFDKMGLLLSAQMQSEEAVVVFNHFTQRPKPPIVVEASFGA